LNLFFRFAFLLLATFGAAAARAEDGAIANPTMLPGALRAMRGDQGDTSQLRLTFERFSDGRTGAPLTAWIGSDYFALMSEDGETIYDFRLRRRLVVDRKAQSLVNLSLYGDVIFRQIELTRRIEIAQVIEKKTADQPLPESLESFWIESELSLPRPGQDAPELEQRTGGEGVVRFLHAGNVVAAFKPGTQAVSRALRHSYAAFLRYRLPLHPRIARAIADTGYVPAQLDYVSEAKGEAEKVALRLKEARTLNEDYPLPQSLSLVLLPSGNQDPDVLLLRKVMPNMVDAIGARAAAGPPRSVADYRKAIDAALKDKKNFEATLLLTALALQWGRGAAACEKADDAAPCHTKDEIEHAVGADKRSLAMFDAMSLQGNEAEKAIAIWRGLDRGGVADGYVVDIFLARLLSVRGQREEAAKSFAAAFAGNPYIATLYRDLGDHYARTSRTDLAWLSYDLGRALPNRAAPDALSSIDQLEQELAKQYPELF